MSDTRTQMNTAAESICEVGRRLWQRGLIAATDGNLSVKLSDGRFLITASGLAKGFLAPSDLLVVDAAGRVLEGATRPSIETARPSIETARPSIETAVHLAIYAARPDVGAVLHAHPPLATASTLAEIDLNLDAPDEVKLQLGHIAVARHADAGSTTLAHNAAEALGDDRALLLARHGAVTVGADIWQALYRLEALEQAARMSLAARLWAAGHPLATQGH